MVRTDRLKRERGIEIRWLAFPLHPEVPEEGLTLEELFAGRRFDVKAAQERLEKVAASLRLPLASRIRTYNTRLAQELAKWAESEGRGDDFHRAVFRAYFGEGKNIGVREELAALAASIGLPADEARHVIRERSFRQAVDGDWARARALAITAVPTFLFDHKKMVGFQPYEALRGLINAP